MFAGLIVVILTVGHLRPLRRVVVGVVLALMLLTLVLRDRHGRTVLQRVAVRIGWRRTRAAARTCIAAGRWAAPRGARFTCRASRRARR